MSIERLFHGIRQKLSPKWKAHPSVSPFPSQGVFPRLRNLQAASKSVADVHHIVGDVHYLASSLPAEKLVLTIHDCAALERLKGWRRELLRQLWFVGPMKRAAVVTTISETTKKELQRWVGDLADKVIVIPNSVRTEFEPTPQPFNTACPVVLQVGTGWNKNVEGVARALIGLSCKLEIIGELSPGQRAILKASRVDYRELGRISDADLLEVYQRCDVMVFASFYEGFGLPILEAQAIGRPVITSQTSAMPDAAGSGALLVDPADPRTIRAAFIKVASDPVLREHLIQEGFRNVKRYQPETVAMFYENIYLNIVHSDSHPKLVKHAS